MTNDTPFLIVSVLLEIVSNSSGNCFLNDLTILLIPFNDVELEIIGSLYDIPKTRLSILDCYGTKIMNLFIMENLYKSK